MAIMRSLIVAAVMAGCLAGPAYAQKKQDDSPAAIEQAEKKKAADKIDQQYRAAIERTRKDASETRADPWQNMRGADESKAKR